MGRSRDVMKATAGWAVLNLVFVSSAMAQSNSCEAVMVLDRYVVPDRPAEDLEVRDGLAYVAFEVGGLHIVDVSDPTELREVGVFKGTRNTQRVALDGPIAWVASVYNTTAGRRLISVDVSDPTTPVELSRTILTDSISDVGASDGFVYVVDRSSELLVYDGTDPAAPVEIARVDLGRVSPRGIEVAGDLAVVWCGIQPAVRIFSIADPANPVELSSIPTDVWQVQDVRMDGDRLYVAGQDLLVYDLSDPSAPVMLGSHWQYGTSLAVAGGVVYLGRISFDLVSSRAGLGVVDLSDPTDPVGTGTYGHTQDQARKIVVSGLTAFSASEESGLVATDLSNRPGPRPVLSVEDTPGFAFESALAGNRLFLADGVGGLLEFDVSDPASPEPVSMTPSIDRALGVDLDQGLLAVADRAGGLLLYNVGAGGVTELGVEPSPTLAYRVRLRDGVAYVADVRQGLVVVDVSVPSSPARLASLSMPGFPRGVRLHGDRAYVCTFTNGAWIVDITDPANPVRLGRVATTGLASDIALRDAGSRVLAYLADSESGLRVIDVTDAAHPVQVALRPTAGLATGVAVRADRLFVSDSTGILTVFDISVPENPVEIFAAGIGAFVGSEGQSLSLPDADLTYVTAGRKGIVAVRVVTGCCLSVANINGDGVLDGSDITQFIEAFVAGDPRADVNHDGVIDQGDLGVFIGLFQSGC